MRTETNFSPHSIKNSHWRWLIAFLFFFQIPNFFNQDTLQAQVGQPCVDGLAFTAQSDCVNKTICFTATGFPNATHQWRYSRDGGTTYFDLQDGITACVTNLNCYTSLIVEHTVYGVNPQFFATCSEEVHYSCGENLNCDFAFDSTSVTCSPKSIKVSALGSLGSTHVWSVYNLNSNVFLFNVFGINPTITVNTPAIKVIHKVTAPGCDTVRCEKLFKFECPGCETEGIPLFTLTKISDYPECKYKLSVVTDGSNSSRYFWDFGDGTPLLKTFDREVEHVFANNGTFTVCLTRISQNSGGATLMMNKCCPVVINCVVECDDFLGFKVKSLDGCTSICFESDHKVGVHNWMLTHNGQTVTATGYTPCFTIPASSFVNKRIVVKQQVILPTGDTCELEKTFVIKCNECYVTFVDNVRPDTCGKIFTVHVTGAVSYIWDFGDGTPIVTTTNTTISHDYLTQGPFNACVIAVFANGDVTQCCTWVGCYCCDNPDFGIVAVPANSPELVSCVNTPYVITPVCSATGFMTHKWIFEDGTVYYGPIPPNHVFTDFINFDNEVCVTHEIRCGTNLYSITKCIPFPSGAFLGYPGQDRKLTDNIKFAIPAVPNTTFPQTVHGLLDYCIYDDIDVFIEGKLIIDEDGTFDGDGGSVPRSTWLMTRSSEVEILEDRLFTLANMNVWSAAKVGYVCCTWKGMTARPNSTIGLFTSNISHADRMLRFEKNNSTDVPSGAALFAVDNIFEEDSVGIFSNEQLIDVLAFENNIFRGILMQHLCSCESYVGIWLKDVQGLVKFPAPSGSQRNLITNYKMGIYLENSPGEIKNFNLTDISSYGIHFSDSWTNNRIVNLDYLSYLRIPVAVRLQKSGGGLLSLGATATVAGAVSHLRATDVKIGYDILLTGASKIDGTIKQNEIRVTNITDPGLPFDLAGPYANGHFGIRGEMASTSNLLLIKENTIDVNGVAPALPNNVVSNAGVTFVNSTILSLENIRIHKNLISVGGTASGSGIGINIQNIKNTNIYDNQVYLSGNTIDGIRASFSPNSIVRCNKVYDGKDALLNIKSLSNMFTDNRVEDNRNGIVLQGVSTNTKYKRNELVDSDLWGISFNTGAMAGPQDNDGQYNSFIGFPNNTNWVDHIPAAGSTSNLFRRIGSSGTIYNPRRAAGLFGWFAAGIPASLNTAQCIDEILPPMDSLLGGGDEEMIYELIQNDFFETEVNESVAQDWKQDCYHYISTHTLTGANAASIASWYESMQNTTLSAVMDRNMAIAEVQTVSESANAALDAQRNQLDALRTQIDNLVRIKNLTVDLALKETYEQQLVPMYNSCAALNLALQNAAAATLGTINSAITAANTTNNALAATTVNDINDQELARLVLLRMSGAPLTSTENIDLLNIANQCYDQGGASVPAARSLYLQWFGVYISDDDCSSAFGGGSSERASSNGFGNIVIAPNPTDNELKISFSKEMQGQAKEVFVSDVSGRILQSIKVEKQVSEFLLSTVRYPDGVYFLKIEGSDRNSKVTKFVVKH